VRLDGLVKLDIWRPREPEVGSYAWLSLAEWENYLEEAGESPLPGHPMPLDRLSRSTICNKALPSILQELARVRGELADRDLERCLDLFGWVVGPG
jgi:hypothetical protein